MSNTESNKSKEVARWMRDARGTTRLSKTENQFLKSDQLYLSKTGKQCFESQQSERSFMTTNG
jgi:hypothetical protein